MLQRPDPQSFTKFLTSAGLFLCLLALVGPGLVLRETKLLQIKEADLQAYTPLARKELNRRQAVARGVALASPYAGGVLLALGLVALLYSVPRLYRQEGAEDERVQAELEKLKREIAPQSPSERRARIEAEVEETSADTPQETADVALTPADGPTATHARTPGAVPEEASEVEASATGTPERPSAEKTTIEPSPAEANGATDAAPKDRSARTEAPSRDATKSERQLGTPPLAEDAYTRAELMTRVADAEERVLRRIARIAGPLYELQPQVRVGGRSSLLLDGLLVSSVDQLPDVAIEIKYVRSPNNLGHRVREQLMRLESRRMSAELRNAKLWLIVVTESALSSDQLERVADLAARGGPDFVVSVVQEARIDELELPRGRFL